MSGQKTAVVGRHTSLVDLIQILWQKLCFAWEFQLETFLKGKTLWGHIDGSSNGGSTAEMSVADKAAWDAKDNQIMSWILGSMEPHLILSLRPHSLRLAIANYTQGDLSVQDYYSGFRTLWNDYSDLVTAKVSAEGLEAVQLVHKTSQKDQFLMKLRPDFESIRASLVNRDPVPTLEACFGELLREEQRLNTQNIMEQSRVASNTVSVAYAAHGKGKGRDMSTTQCYSCKKYGHIALLSSKFSNGTALPIVAVGDVSSSFKDVLVSPNLSDQMSGQLIAKGPKHGRLFSLQIPVPQSLPSFSVLSLLCNKSRVSNEVWHKRLGHPNSRILSYFAPSTQIERFQPGMVYQRRPQSAPPALSCHLLLRRSSIGSSRPLWIPVT
ncbi:hypothetical protein Patl1_35235 [Pistacia atlantica]|uniref:Uncharacterized protein n=1 Tax=Pistacia atlantica TaxID=434234 RepID=A0ACC0ZUW9_9ROSI|nr:hypothetical protein Patl1_35235 [Pistacia atlantica]